MYITRQDVRLHCETEGSGPAVLLIHGHTLDVRVWSDLSGPLIRAGMRAVRYDLRGHGRSSVPERDYRFSDHAADALAVINGLGIDRCGVIGYSIGGGIAIELALAHPARVTRLALLSPVLPDRPFEAVFFDNLREVAHVARTRGIREAMLGPWINSPLWASSLATPGVRERLETVVSEFPGAEYLATARDTVERDWKVADRLGEISAPTLVVVGEAELPGFRAWAGEIAAGIPGARLEVLHDLGHLHLLQDPERVSSLLIDHLGDERGRHSEATLIRS